MSQSITLRGMTMLRAVGRFRPTLLDTANGVIETRYYETTKGAPCILWLGDAAGGFDSPAVDLFDTLAEQFQDQGVSSLRLQYRRPSDRVENVLDALVASFMIQSVEVPRFVAVGYGLGATAAVETARQFPTCAGVALLAPTGIRKEAAKGLARPLLVLHGTGDTVAHTQDSRDMLAQADEPKRIVYYPGAGHDFASVKAEVAAELSSWLTRQLGVGDPV